MQFGRIAGVQALCFASFHLCQQMKGGRRPGEIGGLSPREKQLPGGLSPKEKNKSTTIMFAR